MRLYSYRGKAVPGPSAPPRYSCAAGPRRLFCAVRTCMPQLMPASRAVGRWSCSEWLTLAAVPAKRVRAARTTTKATAMIDYRSDNTGRAAPQILEALVRANHDTALGYGADEWTATLQQRFSELFETPVRVFPVATGTAANALSLAALGPSWGIVYCSEAAHINTAEANATGFFGGGLKLAAVGGEHGKIAADWLAEVLAGIAPGQIHRGQPSAVSLTQATDLGAVYALDQIRAVADVAKRRGLKLHMDGARFAN